MTAARDAGMAALGGRAGRRPGGAPAENSAPRERMLGESTNGALPRGLRSGEEAGRALRAAVGMPGLQARRRSSALPSRQEAPLRSRRRRRRRAPRARPLPPGAAGPQRGQRRGSAPTRPTPLSGGGGPGGGGGRVGGGGSARLPLGPGPAAAQQLFPGAAPRGRGSPGRGALSPGRALPPPSGAAPPGRHRDFPPRRARATPPNSARSGRRPTATAAPHRAASAAPRPVRPRDPPAAAGAAGVGVGVGVGAGASARGRAAARGAVAGHTERSGTVAAAVTARRPRPPPPSRSRTLPPPPHNPPPPAPPPAVPGPVSMETPVRGPRGAVRSPPSARPRRWVRGERARGYPCERGRASGAGRRG